MAASVLGNAAFDVDRVALEGPRAQARAAEEDGPVKELCKVKTLNCLRVCAAQSIIGETPREGNQPKMPL